MSTVKKMDVSLYEWWKDVYSNIEISCFTSCNNTKRTDYVVFVSRLLIKVLEYFDLCFNGQN